MVQRNDGKVIICDFARLRAGGQTKIALGGSSNIDTPIVSMPFVLDLLRSVTLVCSKYCKALITGDVAEQDNVGESVAVQRDDAPASSTAAWLTNDLLQAGLAPSALSLASDGDAFVRQTQELLSVLGASSEFATVALAGTSGGPQPVPAAECKEAVRHMLAHLPHVDSVPVASEASAVVHACVIDIFTVLIHHNHLVRQLQSFSAGDALHADVLRCWKAAHR